MICAGIDLSLTSPAICINLNDECFDFEFCKFKYLTDQSKRLGNHEKFIGTLFPEHRSQYERYENISRWVIDSLDTFGIRTVFIEDYSFGSTGRVFHIAENTGILKYILWKHEINLVTVPPTVVKKIATGKGNANKELMEQAFIQETGIKLKGIFQLTEKQWNPSSDLIDSYYICKYGALQYKKVVD